MGNPDNAPLFEVCARAAANLPKHPPKAQTAGDLRQRAASLRREAAVLEQQASALDA